MNKFESKRSQPKLDANEGWVVQIYGRNRRLFCVLGPSHGWMFLAGCCMGLLLAIVWGNMARYSAPVEPAAPTEVPALQID